MNTAQNITNEMLNNKLDLILKVLEQYEKRFEQIEKRLEYLESRVDRMENKIDDIHDARDKVTVKFSRAFAFVNIFLAALVAYITSNFIIGSS